MVYKEHLIELWVNGNKVELETQNSLGIRFNNVLIDPTKISNTQAEYSFEFEIPATPHNNVILDYANSLAKENKFNKRYNAEVYCDGILIFSGSITINSYKNKKYKLNLVSVKVYSLEDIFGDTVMTDIKPMQRDENGTIIRDDDGKPLHKKWDIEFNGVNTINQRNAMADTDVVFPLVSYGVFQKKPYQSDSVSNDYTSKFDLDEWNRWYVESFFPSHNLMETLKNCFETKDYNVGGDVFTNPYLKNIYMSNNLADEQSPDYNIGNPLFGRVKMNVNWTTPSSGVPYVQELSYPYGRIGGFYSTEYGTVTGSNWNFSSIQVYDMMSSAEGGNYTMTFDTYMFHPEETTIVIPADGWYKVNLDALATLSPSQSALTASQYYRTSVATNEIEEGDVTIPVSFTTTMPLEIQLVRNYDDNIELIKGKNNILFKNGKPGDATFNYSSNRYNTTSCFPHEQPGSVWFMGGFIDGYVYAPPTDITKLGDPSSSSMYDFQHNVGYLYKDQSLMMYDQFISPAFICGFTSMGNDNGGGCAAVMRNGRSWTKRADYDNGAFYTQTGYDAASTPVGFVPTWEIYTTASTFNQNEYLDSPTQVFSQVESTSTKRFMGSINTMVYLKKNDKLKLFAVQRDYTNSNGIEQRYTVSVIANLEIKAASPKSEVQLRRENYGYLSDTQFDTRLNLANFLNEETKMSDWVKNVVDAFNLDVIQDGNNVSINTRKKASNNVFTAVDIDNRVNSDEAEASKITYPRSMAVKYSVDDEEWGFERSAVENAGGDESILDRDDWKKYADSGYTVIQLNDDSWETSTSEKSLKFSYTWYDNFNQYQCNSAHTKTSETPVTLKLPVISKFSYMIDGYDYDESMKHDGYGLPQRLWFKPVATGGTVWTSSYPAEQITLYVPSNVYNGEFFNLSYKNTEPSLLSEFFNTSSFLASNYVEVDVYLTPEEYNRIKCGSLVHMDSDLYIPVEISGYDPSGYNPTTLKLMKKVI